MTKDNKPAALQDAELDQANGGFRVDPNGERLLGNRGNDLRIVNNGDGSDFSLPDLRG